MTYTYKTKSIEERIWLVDMAIDHGLISGESNMNEILVNLETETDWELYPYIVYYPDIGGFIDLRQTPKTEVSLDELLALTNMLPKLGLIPKHIKKPKFI
tara:strand:- start:793 stop:1092 length:300 start_codon:yes stop_codon:yes gene_type:complete